MGNGRLHPLLQFAREQHILLARWRGQAGPWGSAGRPAVPATRRRTAGVVQATGSHMKTKRRAAQRCSLKSTLGVGSGVKALNRTVYNLHTPPQSAKVLIALSHMLFPFPSIGTREWTEKRGAVWMMFSVQFLRTLPGLQSGAMHRQPLPSVAPGRRASISFQLSILCQRD